MAETEARRRARMVDIRLLATTDLHGHLMPWDYVRGAPRPGAGLAVLAATIERLRKGAPNVMLFDVGDLLQGTALVDVAAREGQGRGPHPMIAALGDLGCDAATLGNHDFDFGLEALRAAHAGAPFPIVCANVQSGRPGWPARARAMLERDFVDTSGRRRRVRVGVTGVVPPETARCNADALGGELQFSEMVPAAASQVARLRKEGADLVVLLAHTGLAQGDSPPDPDQRARELACIEGVDAVLAGHSHRPEVVPAGALGAGSAPVVVGPANAGGVAAIDLRLELTRRGGRPSSAVRIVDIDRAALPHRRLLEIGRLAHARAEAELAQPLARTSTPIRSHFALVADASAMNFVNDAKCKWVAAQLGEAAPEGAPIVAASAPFRVGAFDAGYLDIAPGPLRRRDLHSIYGFANTVVAFLARGRDLAAWLERSACVFNRIEPGRGAQPLLAPGAAAFNFDVISGLSWELDLSRDPAFDRAGRPLAGGGRIGAVTWRGAPLDPDQPFVLVTNSYRAGGGGAFPGVERLRRLPLPSARVLEVLETYAIGHKQVAPGSDPAWSFSSVPGAEAIVEAPPDAPVPRGAQLVRAQCQAGRSWHWLLPLDDGLAAAERAG